LKTYFQFNDLNRSSKPPSINTNKSSIKNSRQTTNEELLKLSSLVKKQKTEIDMISLLNKSLSQEVVRQSVPQNDVKKGIIFKLSEILKCDSIIEFQDKVSPLISQPFISYKEVSTTCPQKEFNYYLRSKKLIKDEKIDTTEFEKEYLEITYIPK